MYALYEDGQLRPVGKNDRGGYDWQTVKDEESGLCKVGVFAEELRIPVPENILKELIRNEILKS